MNNETGIEKKKTDTSVETLETNNSQGLAQKELILAEELLGIIIKAVEDRLIALKETLQITTETVQEETEAREIDKWIPIREKA